VYHGGRDAPRDRMANGAVGTKDVGRGKGAAGFIAPAGTSSRRAPSPQKSPAAIAGQTPDPGSLIAYRSFASSILSRSLTLPGAPWAALTSARRGALVQLRRYGVGGVCVTN
jgi:hypothetical protein